MVKKALGGDVIGKPARFSVQSLGCRGLKVFLIRMRPTVRGCETCK